MDESILKALCQLRTPRCRWAGVRKDIDVRVGSAEDHWPVVADVHLSIGEPRENWRKQSASIDRNLVHDQQRVLNFQNRLEHVVLRDELEIEPLCSALTADVANAADAANAAVALVVVQPLLAST